ncbi:MAG: TRAP transporter large permease subunit [Myxococcales bacterium]
MSTVKEERASPATGEGRRPEQTAATRGLPTPVSTEPLPSAAHEKIGERPGGTAVEKGLLVIIVLVMILLPTLEALLRRAIGVGVPDAMPYTQHLTLWVGFVGAMLATATERHLALSTVELLPDRWQKHARGYVHVISALITAVLAYAAVELVLADRGRDDTLAGDVPEWWFEIIMPIGFAVMAYRSGAMAPTRRWRIAAWVAAAAVIPFVLSRILALKGHGFLPVLDGPTLVRGHPGLVSWPGSLVLLGAFLLGAPVFIAMAGFALLLFFLAGTPVAAVPAETFRLVIQPTLPAIPLLTVAGYVLAEGGASQRLVRAAQAVFGWMPGGLAIVAASVCALFTTFTGASGVTILALGGIIFPALIREGYPEGFSLGLVTASGSLGLLFPPSLPVILYGVVANVGIDHLYLGGLVPGVLMIVLVAMYGVLVGVKSHAPRIPFDAKDAAKALWGSKWDIGLPLLIVVAVASGFATIVEAAALGAAYAIVVELLVFRDVHPFRDLPRVLVHASTLVGSVVILLGVALGFTSYLVDAEIPTRLLAWVQAHIHSQWEFLLALNVLLLVLGSVLEIYSAIVVLAPLVAPLGVAFGVDPVHLGVVFLANLELGFLFPPMGLNLFLSASRFDKPLPYLYRKALPFLIIMAIGVLLITYVPAITTGVVALRHK